MTQYYIIASSLQLANGQLNRYVREALHVFRSICEHIGLTEEFTHEDAFDCLGQHVTGSDTKQKKEKRRITAALNFLLDHGLLEKCADGSLCVSEEGIRFLEEEDASSETGGYDDEDEDSYD